jgi:putative salt-induced outer membrane protein YdiY
MKLVLGVLLSLLCGSVLAHAGTAVFKNGDRLSGALIAVRDGKLSLKSDILGMEVTVPLAKVRSFSTAGPAVIVLQDGSVVHGRVELENSGDWRANAERGSRTVRAAAVRVVLTEKDYHIQVDQTRKPWQDWTGSINFGYSVQHGDQQTGTISSTIAATRERPHDLIFSPHWRTNTGLTMLFSHAQQNGISVTSNTITASLRQDYLFSPRDFVFATGQLDHIGAQGLYLRQTYGGGFGHDLIHGNRAVLSLLGGANYMREHFDIGPSNSSAEVLAGEKLGLKVNNHIRLDQGVSLYPNLTDWGQYRWDANANLGLKLNSRLAVNTGVIDLYLSNPAPGSHKNNIAFTTGLGLTF